MGLASFACKIEGTFITVNDIWRCSVFNHIYSLQPSSNNKNHLYIVCVVNTAPLRLSKNCIMLNTIIGGSPYTTLFCRITKHIKCQYNVASRKSGIGIMCYRYMAISDKGKRHKVTIWMKDVKINPILF